MIAPAALAWAALSAPHVVRTRASRGRRTEKEVPGVLVRWLRAYTRPLLALSPRWIDRRRTRSGVSPSRPRRRAPPTCRSRISSRSSRRRYAAVLRSSIAAKPAAVEMPVLVPHRWSRSPAVQDMHPPALRADLAGGAAADSLRGDCRRGWRGRRCTSAARSRCRASTLPNSTTTSRCTSAASECAPLQRRMAAGVSPSAAPAVVAVADSEAHRPLGRPLHRVLIRLTGGPSQVNGGGVFRTILVNETAGVIFAITFAEVSAC